MRTPEVSIIIPTFNYGKYICEALDSILSQTFENFEIIIVDDGSTDNTRDICLSYGPRIKYIYQDNAGVSAARNKGMSVALGKYISFLDADDIMMPYKLEVQKELMDEADPSTGFISTEFSMYKDGKVVHRFYSKKFFNIFLENKDLDYEKIFSNRKSLRELSCPEEYLERYIYSGNISKCLIMGNFIMPSSTMFRRDCLENFDPSLPNYEDYELFCRLSKKYKAGYLDIPTVLYRVHDDSLSSDKNIERRLKCYFDIVEMVWHRDPRFYGQFKKEINLALARKAYGLGRYYLSNKRYGEAFVYFKESLRNSKMQRSCYAYLLWSYLKWKFI